LPAFPYAIRTSASSPAWSTSRLPPCSANAIERETVIVALSIDDRERILRALDDPSTDGLAELRGVLLGEHEWRRRVGLV
jgi:hypothetical protein